MNRIKAMANENGSVMVVSLIILALATVIGIAAATTASIEIQVSGNEMRHAENFYRAEAAAMVGARVIEETTEDDMETRKFKEDGETGEEITLSTDEEVSKEDIADEANWAEGTDEISADGPDSVSDESAGYKTKFLPVEKTEVQGISLDLANTTGDKMHEFTIYGRSVLEPPNTGKRLAEVIIEIGYKRRF